MNRGSNPRGAASIRRRPAGEPHLGDVVKWLNTEVCKTSIHRFESGRRLHILSTKRPFGAVLHARTIACRLFRWTAAAASPTGSPRSSIVVTPSAIATDINVTVRIGRRGCCSTSSRRTAQPARLSSTSAVGSASSIRSCCEEEPGTPSSWTARRRPSTVARQEARRLALLDRIEFVEGDFVQRAATIDAADIVTLDRVVCCYADAEALVGLSAARVRTAYGLVLPRDRGLVRMAIRLENIWFRLRRKRYRAYVHPTARVDAIAAANGLRPGSERHTTFWRVVVYDRQAAR